MNIIFPTGNNPARFTVVGKDDNNIQRPVNSVTAKISNYAVAFLTSDGFGAVIVNARLINYPTTPGSSVSLTVTISGKNASGDDVLSEVITVVLQGPPLGPVATHFEISNPLISNIVPNLPDPGSDTITV